MRIEKILLTFGIALCGISVACAAKSPYARGGSLTVFDRIQNGGYYRIYVHTFTNANEVETFRNLKGDPLSLRMLVVGGGGAGGYALSNGSEQYKVTSNSFGGGGGGGGGVCETNIVLGGNQNLSIIVGEGGKVKELRKNHETSGDPAGSSRVQLVGDDIITALGGARGAYYVSSSGFAPATTGGANGGGGSYNTSAAFSVGIYTNWMNGIAYGPFSGGKDSYSGTTTGGAPGGGAGAGSDGGDYRVNYPEAGRFSAGQGGEGLSSDITGEVLVYGSGGAGGGLLKDGRSVVCGAAGGPRAGSAATATITTEGKTITGFSDFIATTAPVANSGCGGAGGSGGDYWATALPDTDARLYGRGTDGADGIVVIRYEIPLSGVGGELKTIPDGSDRIICVHTFTNTAEAAEFKNEGPNNLKLRMLVVGGGGAGGYALAGNSVGYGTSGNGYGGGGGGGGGVCETNVVLEGGKGLSILVGSGGKVKEMRNGNVSPDVFAGASVVSMDEKDLVRTPGGARGAYCSYYASVGGAASEGACGGGGVRDDRWAASVGSYVSLILGDEYGPFAGGGGANLNAGGGGAGAGAAGSSCQANYPETGRNISGAGGAGLVSDITGESLTYGSGGAGGGYLHSGKAIVLGAAGGSRAGSAAQATVVGDATAITSVSDFIPTTAPEANSGAGGAGGSGGTAWAGVSADARDWGRGTDGADGVVVIRYSVELNPKPGLILLFR